MLIYDIESAHIGSLVQGKTVTFHNMQVISMYVFLRYNAYLPQHRHVLISDIQSAHTGTRQASDISKYAGYFNVNLSYNAYLPEHKHVLICDFESAHTGTRQNSDILEYAGPINVNLFEL